MLEPTILVDLGFEGGSWMTSGTVVGVPEGASLGRSVDSDVSRGLLRPRGAGEREPVVEGLTVPRAENGLPSFSF